MGYIVGSNGSPSRKWWKDGGGVVELMVVMGKDVDVDGEDRKDDGGDNGWDGRWDGGDGGGDDGDRGNDG